MGQGKKIFVLKFNSREFSLSARDETRFSLDNTRSGDGKLKCAHRSVVRIFLSSHCHSYRAALSNTRLRKPVVSLLSQNSYTHGEMSFSYRESLRTGGGREGDNENPVAGFTFSTTFTGQGVETN